MLYFLLTFCATTTALTTSYTLPTQGCHQDNCLRALENQEYEVSAYAFCKSFLSTTVPTASTGGIPTYLANCGPTSVVSSISSACPCFLDTYTPGSSTTSSSPSLPTQGCHQDNCLRALENPTYELSAYTFCKSFLSTAVPTASTGGVPTYLANCGPTSVISSISSACPCFLETYTPATTKTSSSPTPSTPSLPTQGCHQDNCLRALENQEYELAAYTFCKSFLSTTVPSASTGGVPTYLANCGPPSVISSISSACPCYLATYTPTTTTLSSSTSPTSSSSTSINTSKGYVIVSPSSCPPSPSPTGTPIGQSNSSFSDAYGGVQYQQFANSQFIIQNATSGPFYLDLSSPTELVISDTEGDTLIIYSNGTFVGFVGNCELEIVGSWQPTPGAGGKERRDVGLETRQLPSGLCNGIQFFCNYGIGAAISGFGAAFVCASIGAEVGADIGGGIGFLGNLLGPEVGIPTTIAGVIIGEALGGFVAGRLGQSLCGAGTAYLLFEMCDACPKTNCAPGTITCNGGPCQDALSDPNNCGGCGIVVSAFGSFVMSPSNAFIVSFRNLPKRPVLCSGMRRINVR